MKIQQKTIWIKFLIIGILLNSCTDTQPENNKIYFLYTNKTNENVEIKLYNKNSVNFKNIFVPSNLTTQISYKQNNGKGIGIPFLFDEEYTAKVVIKFETSNKCLINYSRIKESKQYDNYTDSMLNSYGNTLIYYIDKEEFDLATPCQ